MRNSVSNLRLSALILLVALVSLTLNLNGQTVLNNGNLRFGTGSENSVNTNGNLQQPFYYNSTLALWRKLTYSTYPLDNSFAVGGDGSNEWNLNGTIAQNPVMSSQVIDLSGYTVISSPNGYGTIISTGNISIGGYVLEIKNTYELGVDKSFIKITTAIKNTGGSTVPNVRYWVGTRDDYVGGTDVPKKEKGNLVDGAFARITNPAERALALRISTADEGVLFYTNSSKGNNIINSCCSWTNVTSTDPQLSTIEITNDGSYGFYVRMNDLAPGVADEFSWYYASGKLEDLETIIADVAAASGAVSDITYTTATFRAKTTTDGNGYWVIVPRGAVAPDEAQIKAGTDYGLVDVISSGSGPMTANEDHLFYISNLAAGTDYDLYFVSEDATPAFSSIAKVQFATEAYTEPRVTTNPVVTGISLTGATSGGNVTDDGGQPVLQRGICWNTSGSPALTDNTTTDGAGTGIFESSLTGLTEGTTFYARAYATNSVGTSYGNEMSFTTLNTTLSGCQGGSVSIHNAPVYISSGATINGTTLEGTTVSIISNYGSDQDVLGIDGETSGTIGDLSFAYSVLTGILTITGAAEASAYEAVLRKVTYTNTSASPSTGERTIRLSLKRAILTDISDEVALAFTIPATLPATNILSSSFEANWNTVAGASEYLIDVATNSTFSDLVPGYDNKSAGNTGMELVEGLDPVSTYYYRVRAVTNVGSTFNSSVTTATTLKSDQTITFEDPGSRTYGDPSFALAATASSGLDVSYTSSDTGVATISGNDVNIVGAGITTITASQPGNAIYNAAPETSVQLIVGKAMLTIEADDQSKTYGEENPSLTFRYSGWKNGDDSTVLATLPSIETDITSHTGAGIYQDAITLSGADDDNYDFTYIPALFEVTKAQLTITAESKSKGYGTPNPELTFGYGGFIDGDGIADLAAVPSASTAITQSTPAGVHADAITVSGGSDENYSFVYVAANFEVTKATLTVTAEDKTRPYGEANPELTIAYNGFANDDDESDLAVVPAISTTVDVSSFAGVYTDSIIVSGGLDENYNFIYIPGDFTVNKAMLTITADSKSKKYSEANPALTLSFDGFANNDDLSAIDTLPGIITTADTLSDAGEYAITLSGGSDDNYELNAVNGILTIEKVPVTVTADDQNKIYLEPVPALTIRYSGFVAGQDQSCLDVLPVAETDADMNSDAGMYDIVVSGALDNNYSFDYVKGILNVLKADQVITFEDVPNGLRASEQYQLAATSTSGLPVNFQLSDNDIAGLSGDVLTVKREGNLVIYANQEGDNNWNPADAVTESIRTLPGFDNIMSLFTPNNDGVNDYWYIPDIEQYGRIAVVIYNRFGKKVYQSDNYSNDWDGTWNGDALPSASYYYIINSQTRGTIKGAVNIVR